MKKFKIRKSSLLVLLLKVSLCGLLLLQATSSVVYGGLLLLQATSSAVHASTFVKSTTLTINGTFTDWGTPGAPTSGVYLFQDENVSPPDGTGFSGKPADINYFWMAVSTASGDETEASPSNLILDFYYRFDTWSSTNPKGQSYFLILNLGVAASEYADHLLQLFVDNTATPQVTIVLYEYDTPYPLIVDYAISGFTAQVANVPGYGIEDPTATGGLGIYDSTYYGIEVNIPVGWYSSTYGGAVTANGTGASVVIGTAFTSTGSLGSVGNVKDTLNDAAGKTNLGQTSTTTGESIFGSYGISKIAFTTAAQSISVGEVSSIMTIQTQDVWGSSSNVTADTSVNLTSTSGTGKFSLSDSSWSDITSVTITNGTNSASFYYKDTTVGTPTITAAESPDQDWTDATQPETITGVADISNSPSNYAFGLLAEGATANTTLTYFTVTNDGSSNVTITIGGTDMVGGVTWTLADDGNAGTGIYGLKAGLQGDSDYTIIVNKAGGNTLISNLAASANQSWGLQLLAPTLFDGGGLVSGNVTLTATQA